MKRMSSPGSGSNPARAGSHRQGVTEDSALSSLSAQAERLRALSSAHPLALDMSMGALILVVSYFGLSTQNRLGPQTILFGIALCAPLPLRRVNPDLTFAAIVAVAFAQWLISPPQLADAALLAVLYSVAERSRSVSVALALAVMEGGAIAATLKWAVVDPLKIWVGLSGLAVAAAGAGIVMRQRRELLASLRERADRLEQERDQQGHLAAAAERARIAREMHDIVSHNLTVMIALADGASYAMEASPDQARPAVERISATGRQALGEMRRLLGVLRDEPAAGPLEPQPSLTRLDALISQVEAAGIPVAVRVEGDPQGLSEGVQLAIFRVAQEALTNTLKHAVDPTRATLTLRCGPGRAIALELTDDGRALVPVGSPAAGSGRGLPGMRERAAAYDGRLEAGPLPDGGWRVRLSLDA
jgi:signal transduction histidine kinase